ncbi:hypothetical protein SEPL_509 [Salmonella phage SE_PL]|nr:hypothetical protein 7t3_038 [Salmonella phage 7t3]QIG63122.1 hypothetical protein SEPL_509 [Salmonella phage SE_PL]
MKFDPERLLLLLQVLSIPTNTGMVSFNPVKPMNLKNGDSVKYPCMLFGINKSHNFTCTDMYCMLIVKNDSTSDYCCTWWFTNDKFMLSLIDNDDNEDPEMTRNISDTVAMGNFHKSEEEHFQKDCLSGTPITWELEVAVKECLSNLKSFYNAALAEWNGVL